MQEHDKCIIVTVRGTAYERDRLNAAAKREGISVNTFVRQKLGMRPTTREPRPVVVVEAEKVTTPHGVFTISRRASWGFSVVRAKRKCWNRNQVLEVGDLAIVEHRTRPRCKSQIGMGWSEHVATYTRDGVEQGGLL